MTELATSEVLYRAADLIEERGWTQGFWEATNGQVCLEGGLLAARGAEMNDTHELWKCPAYQAVADYLNTSEPDPVVSRGGGRGVWRWNDEHDRTEAEVIETLRACAVIEAARETPDIWPHVGADRMPEAMS